MAHVCEHELLANAEFCRKAVVADDVAGEAAHAAKAIGVRLNARFGRSDNLGTVGHLQHIGHVCGCGGIDNGVCYRPIGCDVENRGEQDPRANGNGFARL